MRVQGPDLPSRASNPRHRRHRLEKLQADVAGALNKFVGKSSARSLTIPTLEEVQTRFWSPNDKDQAAGISLMEELWKVSRKPIKAVLEAQTQKQEIKTHGFTKLPVIGSTREGIDIVIGFSAKGGPASGGKDNDGKLKAVSLDVNPGGSSINVARALTNFGTPFELVGIIGQGDIGNMFLKALEKEGIKTEDLFRVSEDTRIYFSTAVNSKEYWLVSRSPKLSSTEIDQFTDVLLAACTENEKEILALENNSPNGANEMYMPEIIEETQDKHGMFVIFDPKIKATTPEEVHAVLAKSPGMVKPNLAELGQIVNVDEDTLRSNRDLLIHLVQQKIRQFDLKMVLVSMDKDGALLIDKKRAAHAQAPPIKVASPGCAGDTGIAAVIDVTKQRDFSPRKLTDPQFKRVVSAFVAGGAATAAKPGSNIATLEEMQELEKGVQTKFI